jgi:hypothetical protein
MNIDGVIAELQKQHEKILSKMFALKKKNPEGYKLQADYRYLDYQHSNLDDGIRGLINFAFCMPHDFKSQKP